MYLFLCDSSTCQGRCLAVNNMLGYTTAEGQLKPSMVSIPKCVCMYVCWCACVGVSACDGIRVGTLMPSLFAVPYLCSGELMSGEVTLFDSIVQQDPGFTDIGELGIQSGFLRRYSPGSSSSPTPGRVS